jgi:hypothetical protein
VIAQIGQGGLGDNLDIPECPVCWACGGGGHGGFCPNGGKQFVQWVREPPPGFVRPARIEPKTRRRPWAPPC